MKETLAKLNYDPGPAGGLLSDQTAEAAEDAKAEFWVLRGTPMLFGETAARWCNELEKYRAVDGLTTQATYITNQPPNSTYLRIVKAAVEAARRVLGIDVPARIYAYDDIDLMAAAARKEFDLSTTVARRLMEVSQGRANTGAMIVSLNAFDPILGPRIAVFRVAAHEYAHLVMFRLADSSSRDVAPFWMVEGLAESIADRALFSRGQSQTWNLEAKIRERQGSKQQILKQYESGRSAWPSSVPYEIPHIAVDILIRETSFEAVTVDYWDRRAAHPDEPWQTSFAEVFGMSVAEFYDVFDDEFAPDAGDTMKRQL